MDEVYNVTSKDRCPAMTIRKMTDEEFDRKKYSQLSPLRFDVERTCPICGRRLIPEFYSEVRTLGAGGYVFWVEIWLECSAITKNGKTEICQGRIGPYLLGDDGEWEPPTNE